MGSHFFEIGIFPEIRMIRKFFVRPYSDHSSVLQLDSNYLRHFKSPSIGLEIHLRNWAAHKLPTSTSCISEAKKVLSSFYGF